MPSQVVVITGGFGALGRAVAATFVERGARVALLDVAASPPADLAKQLGEQHLLVGGVDVAEPVGAQSAVEKVVQKFGGLDVLVNIAGGFVWQTVQGGSTQEWDDMYRMNVRTALCMSQAALPHLLKRGQGARIINIGANAAAKAGLGMAAYTAAKSGVLRLTESLAEELKNTGVTVNAVLPSVIDTPRNRADMPNEDPKQWVLPAALGRVIAFLASPDAQAVTGAGIPVVGRGNE
jgi:NAD(P)-dependent dehydrogenase (short-subunit alcohol dehydrogenase family)